VRSVAKRISALMSTSAKSLVPAATRAIASCDPLAMLVETARPSEPNKPLADAITKGRRPHRSGGRGKTGSRPVAEPPPQPALSRAETRKTQQA